MEKALALIKTLRLKRWYINLLVIAGSTLAVLVENINTVNVELALRVFTVTIGVCLLSSAHYAINEVLDAKTDANHPEKKNRVIPRGIVSKTAVVIMALGLYVIVALGLIMIGNGYLVVIFAALAVAAFLYNVPPFRLKDIPYVDFILEAINNPLRLAIGWYAVTSRPLPASLFIALWAFTAFLMSAKRFTELRFIANKDAATLYRKSFASYTEEKLMLAMFASSCAFMFTFGVLTIRYEKNLLLAFPLYVLFMVWLLSITHQKKSFIGNPEHIFSNKLFLLFLFSLLIFSIMLSTLPITLINV